MNAFQPNFPGSQELFTMIKDFKKVPVCGWFNRFDEMTGGFYEGQTIIIGGSTGGGKTTLAVNLVHQLATRFNVAYISTETSEIEIAQRVLKRYNSYKDVPPMSLQIFDEDSMRNSRRVGPAMRYTPQCYDGLDNVDFVILDYLKTDCVDATEGGRQMRELVDIWRRYAETTGKIVILFSQIQDWKTDTFGNFSSYNDFWLSKTMCQPAYTVLAVHRVEALKGKITSAIDVIKNRNSGTSEYILGRFVVTLNTDNCEIDSVSEIKPENQAKDMVKPQPRISEADCKKLMVGLAKL